MEILLQELDHDITLIDSMFVRKGMAAIYLLRDNKTYALIEVCTNYQVPLILEVLKRKNISLNSVKYIIVTHIHLDHAGGVGKLLQYLPNAKVIVHPRGAYHLANPEKLIAGVKQVYGEEKYYKLFGDLIPVPEEKIIKTEDNMKIKLENRELELIHIQGHAKHHIGIIDKESNGIFTGDTFGISFRELDTKKGPFIFPSTSPIQFDPVQAKISINRILNYSPKYVYLTHFGRLDKIEKLGEKLNILLDKFVKATDNIPQNNPLEYLKDKITQIFLEELKLHECELPKEKILEILKVDIEINSQGLLYWATHYKNK